MPRPPTGAKRRRGNLSALIKDVFGFYLRVEDISMLFMSCRVGNICSIGFWSLVSGFLLLVLRLDFPVRVSS